MAGVVRQGDINQVGGKALGGVGSVLVNGRPIVVDGTKVSPHGKGKHAVAKTSGGVGSVRAGGKPVNVIGNVDDCGHPRTQGSSNVNAG
jgi:uncharacterized Zn-binding protein involved in type VI secretion